MAFSLRATGIKAARPLAEGCRLMPARRVTTVTMPVDGRSGVAFEAYRDRTPLLTIWAARPGLLVTLTLPEHLNAGTSGSPATSPRPRSGTRPR